MGGGKKNLPKDKAIEESKKKSSQKEIWILLMYFYAHLFFISQSIISSILPKKHIGWRYEAEIKVAEMEWTE